MNNNKRFAIILFIAAAILAVPFIAMRFTDEVNWNWFDFLVAGVLLFGTGTAIEFALRKVTDLKYRLAMVAAILVALFPVWAELAVGIIGSPLARS